MEKIRVLLANHPAMIPDAIRQLVTDQEDMELVGDCRGPMKILQETGKANADVVILAQEGSEELGLCSHLLAIYPDLTIVSVTPDVGIAYTQQLHPIRRQIDAVSEEKVLQSLRVAIGKQFGRAIG